MKNFILSVFKFFAAMILAAGLFLFVMFLMLVAAGTFLSEEEALIKDGSALVLDLSFNIADSPRSVSPMKLVEDALDEGRPPQVHLKKVVDTLDRAAGDERISSLFLHGSLVSDNYGSSFSALREVSAAIKRFKGAGKLVVAYLDDPSLRDYYLMSAADTVVLNPYGFVILKGLAANPVFFGNAFKKYGVGVQVSRVGEFKSAVETFTRDSMSPESALQMEVLLESLWGSILQDIAEDRQLELEQLRHLSDTVAVFSAEKALEAGLVDELGYFDEVLAKLTEIADYDEEEESFTQVKFFDYAKEANDWVVNIAENGSPKIAVVYVEGVIVGGEGDPQRAGGNRLSRELRKARNDEEVKAIVLRVNSPGGSAQAAEVIEREVALAGAEKPVVVSMGGYAASGGYWISARAKKIFAEETTITGSIGVFGLIPNIEKIANEHGVTFDGVKTSPFADIMTISRPKSPAEMGKIQEFTDWFYEQFIEKVAKGRDLSPAEVEKIASGRVWTGIDAFEVGLVDQIGGLDDAINEAAALAGLGDNWRLMQMPEESEMDKLLRMIIEEGRKSKPLSRLDPVSQIGRLVREEWRLLDAFNDPLGIYARLPFDILSY